MQALRNHPSLFLWCGGNEFSPRRNRQAVSILSQVVAAEDGLRPFVAASPGPGDAHNWQVWHGQAPLAAYRDERAAFVSEFGLQAVPNVDSLRRFLSEVDLWPPGPAWQHHNADLDKLHRYAQWFGEGDITTNIRQRMQKQMPRQRTSQSRIMTVTGTSDKCDAKSGCGCGFGKLRSGHPTRSGRRAANSRRTHASPRGAFPTRPRARTDRWAGGVAMERPLAGDQLERDRRLWPAQTCLRDTAADLPAGIGESGVSAASLQTKRPAVWYAVGGQRPVGGATGLPSDGVVGRWAGSRAGLQRLSQYCDTDRPGWRLPCRQALQSCAWNYAKGTASLRKTSTTCASTTAARGASTRSCAAAS